MNKRRFLPLVLAGGLLAAAAVPAAAAPKNQAIQTALVGVLAQVAVDNIAILNDSDVDIITVDIRRSLNNLLRNADIDVNVLNDSLNDIDIIDDINIDIQDVDVRLIDGDVVLVVVLNALGDLLYIS